MAAKESKSDLRADYKANGPSLKQILEGNGIGMVVAAKSYAMYKREPDLAVEVWADIRDPILASLKKRHPAAGMIVAEYVELPAVATIIAADKELLGALLVCAGPTSS